MTVIAVWWVGEGEEDRRLIDAVASHAGRVFGVPVVRRFDPDRPAGTFDAARRQHSSTRILEWLARRCPDDRSRLLGVTDVDLFVPVLTFVFGEAQLRGRVALVSTARLRAAAEADGGRTLLARLAKECVHELGHTWGLLHCRTPGCVMSRSGGLAAVDRKQSDLCDDCRARYGELRLEESFDEP